MLDFIKDLISNRGVQLIARYGANGLIALGTKLAITVAPDDANAAAKVGGAFACAGVLWLIDHWSHREQKAAA